MLTPSMDNPGEKPSNEPWTVDVECSTLRRMSNYTAVERRRHGWSSDMGWERWADGKEHRVTLGKQLPDNTSLESKRVSFAQWCRRQNYTYWTSIVGEKTMVIFADPKRPRVPR